MCKGTQKRLRALCLGVWAGNHAEGPQGPQSLVWAALECQAGSEKLRFQLRAFL